MAKRATVQQPPDPDVVYDETATIPKGETRYGMVMDDDEIELLARGVCPERVSVRAFEMLSWKRESNRVTARRLAEPDPITVSPSAATEER